VVGCDGDPSPPDCFASLGAGSLKTFGLNADLDDDLDAIADVALAKMSVAIEGTYSLS
jgi:hypothetical protein